MTVKQVINRCVLLFTSGFVNYLVFALFVVGQTGACAARLSRARRPIAQIRAEQRAARQDPDEPEDPQVPRERRPENIEMKTLARKVGATIAPIKNPCVEGGRHSCYRQALDRTFLQLDTLLSNPERNVRILHLGDSHIAGDYISGTIRTILQQRFGDSGRGYVHINQKAPYGGRRLKRIGPWQRGRIVDKGQAGLPFGFSGMSFQSMGKNAILQYALDDDRRITIYYYANPEGAELSVSVGNQSIGTLQTYSASKKTLSKSFTVPRRKNRQGKDSRVLRIRARGPGARLFGISYTQKEKGLLYDAVGPVGADARVYLSLERRSLVEHLQLLKPDLVIIMLGGNDALRVRKGKASVKTVGKEHQQLIELVQYALPESDCMLWSPMDAGKMSGGGIVSKSHINEVRYIQQKIALRKGCAFWDMYEAMGENGAVKRWARQRIMNKDLVHPRRKAGELLGYLFSEALLNAYDQTE